MVPLGHIRPRPHHLTSWATVLDALALLSATGYHADGILPTWLYAVLATMLLCAGVILYQLTLRLYIDYRRRQRRAERAARLDKLGEERRAN